MDIKNTLYIPYTYPSNNSNNNTNTNTNILSTPLNGVATELSLLKEKKEYGNPIINYAIEYLQKQIGQLDLSAKQNRYFCYLLIGKLKKDFPKAMDEEIKTYLEKIIDLGRKNDFHCKNLTNFKYIYNHYKQIIN